MGFWHIIDPVERRNLITNPSFEYGTAGWGTLVAGTLGTTSGVQAFGAWAGSVAPSTNGTAGVLGPLISAGNGTAYSYSFYGLFPVGSVFRAGMGDSSGNNLISGSFVGTGGGTWHRYVGSWTEPTGATRRLAIRKENSAVTTAFYVDGHQVEVGSVTTYIDGDRGNGYRWDGAPHASSSLRSADARTGGSVIPLADIGMYVMESPGMGMPEVTTILQDYANIDGAFYQRTRTGARTLTLVTHIPGTTWQHFHAQRHRIIQLIKPDRTRTQQPFRLLYSGAGGTLSLDAVYDGGLAFGQVAGFTENVAIKLLAPDPYWYSETERGTSLAPQINLGSTNFLAYRNPAGQWGTIGDAGVTIGLHTDSPRVRVLARTSDGTILVGGRFGTVAGGQGSAIAIIVGTAIGTIPNSQFAPLTGYGIQAIAVDSAGSITVGGDFTVVGGTLDFARRFIARRTSTGWGSLPGGTLAVTDTMVTSLQPYGGTLVIGIGFNSGIVNPQGTGSTRGLIMHTGGNYGTFTAGTLNSGVTSIALVGRSIVVGGPFGGAGGTSLGNGLAILTANRWGTIPGTVDAGGASPMVQLGGLGVLTSQRIVAGMAQFAGVNGGTTFGVLQSNLTSITAMGYGLGSTANDTVAALQTAPTGELWAGGRFSSSGTTYAMTGGLARWTGARWVNADIDIPPPGTVAALLFQPDGGLYIGGTFAGTATAAAVGTVMVPTSANTPITLRMRGPAGGTARIFQLTNVTANTNLWFDLTIQDGETITVTTHPGSVTVQSTYRGNLMDSVVAGSNLAAFRLLPGTNTLSFFADTTALRTDLVYRPAYWSSDGTV